MKKLFYLFTILIVISSCNNHSDNKDETIKNADSSITKNFIFDETDFKQFTLPLVIDSNFIQKLDSNSRITYQNVKALGNAFLEGELGKDLIYDFNDFCKIDSIKQAGKYDDYISKLDIGMTKTSIAYKVGCIKLNESSRLFIWGISNTSYEACPYFSGTKLIGTYFVVNKPPTHFFIAGQSAGGDPPSHYSNLTTSNMNNDGTIDVKSISVYDDSDIPGNGTEQIIVKLKTENNILVVANTKKEEKSTEKVPQ